MPRNNNDNPRYDDERDLRRRETDRETDQNRGAAEHGDPGVIFLGRIAEPAPTMSVPAGQTFLAVAYRVARIELVDLINDEIEGTPLEYRGKGRYLLAANSSRYAAPKGSLVIVFRIQDRFCYIYY